MLLDESGAVPQARPLAEQVSHWTARLAGAPTVLELPADRPRPPVLSSRRAAPHVLVPAELSRTLRSFSQDGGVSLFSVLYAGFAALLYRYTGQQDLLVGSGDTVVLRAQVSAAQPFRSLVGQANEAVLDTLNWPGTPLDAVIEAIGPDRDPSRAPLFQVMFSDSGRADGSAKTDLNVTVVPGPGHDDLAMIWEHSADLFDEATIARMATHYLTLLADAVARPQVGVGVLELVTAAQARQLGEWGRGPVVSDARPVTELVAGQVRRRPEAVAVSDPEVSLTYGELGERAGQFAARLVSLGVGPETVVAVYAGRSAYLVTGELAVAMTGAAFLPLDPDNPAQRTGELLARSGAAALLTTSPLTADLPSFAGPVLVLDQPASPPEPPLAVAVHTGSVAYVIYTSGSTGQPKGVQVTHDGLANLVGWHREAYQLGPGERSTLVASPAFDASVWEIWPALASGGTIVVPPEDVRLVPRDLASWMAAQRITWAFMPTPLAEAVLDESWPPGTVLRYLLTGGDAIRRTTPDGLPFTLVNHYGPTETTVTVTGTPLPPGGPATPPIGRPLGGVAAYVLAGLQPVPVGVPGELCIGGAGVTRGY
ncbi:MAG: non-ribosomal peptide synthetase, partial [Streptosporangiaceae bacterium]